MASPVPLRDPTKKKWLRAANSGPGWSPPVEWMEIFALQCRGIYTVDQIAEMFNSTQRQIAYRLRKITAWLVPIFIDNVRSVKSAHTSMLQSQFIEAMRAWDRSKSSETVVTTEEVNEDGEFKTTSRRVTKQGVGEPRFLEQARKALEDIRKIWGADAPIQVQHSGEIRVAGMSREDAIKKQADHLHLIRNNLIADKASQN